MTVVDGMMGGMKKPLSVAAVVAMLMLVGCSSAPDDAPAPKRETVQPESTPVEPVEEVAVEQGTESDPWPVGTPVTVGDWELTVNSWQPDVNAEVEAAGDDLSMLQDGEQYALLNVTMTWLGEGVGDNSLVNLQYMPSGGNTISSSWSAWGTTPGDNKLAYEELVTGGTVTGDMLYTVDAGNTEGVFMVVGKTIDDVQYLAAQ